MGKLHRHQVAGILIVFLLSLLAWWRWPQPQVITTHLDHAKGLAPGDSVYLQGVRIGSVLNLRPQGRRVLVELEIQPHKQLVIPEDAQFLLWRDERQPNAPGRLAVRIQIPYRESKDPRNLRPPNKEALEEAD